MKKGTAIMLSILLIFLGVVLGLIFARCSSDDSIMISYQTGSVNTPDQTLPQSIVAATTPLKQSIGIVNINTATLSQLTSLPNIGEGLAQRIIDYRTANGPFKAIEDIMNVEGIGQTRFDQMKDDITVGG